MSCAAPVYFAVRCTDARRTFATPAEGWVTVPTCARPRASNASKCPTSSAAGGGSGNAPQKHLQRRWRPAYGPPANVHDPSFSRAPSRGRSVTPAGRRSRSRGRSRSSGRSCSSRRSHSGIRPKETTWADRVKQKPPKVTKGSPPEQSNPRIEQLEQENAQLRAALEQLRAQFESFRKSHSSTPAPSAPQRRRRRYGPPRSGPLSAPLKENGILRKSRARLRTP
ncbi:hypothetical protein MTO96_015114 [Rhipicephalus appendiculatus]